MIVWGALAQRVALRIINILFEALRAALARFASFFNSKTYLLIN
jgi:hypothetical protein